MEEGKIKVLQIVPTLGAGGISSVVQNYYRYIDKSRFVFDFITHGGKEEFHEAFVNSGSKIFYVGTIPQNGIFKYFAKMIRIIKGGHYDVVHFHVRKIRWLLLPYARKSSVKIVLTHAHSTSAGAFAHFWAWWASLWATKFLACGVAAGKAVYCGRKFKVLPNAIDIEKFTSVEEKQINSIRCEFGPKVGKIIIGTVGAIIKLKNHTFLIEIAKELRNRNVNFSIVVVGDGSLKGNLEAEIDRNKLADNFILLGRRDDVNILMNVFDVFVLPSLYEGFPVVGVEAQAGGCPCVFSDHVTNEVNLGITPVRFVSLSASDEWADTIISMAGKRVSPAERYEKLINSDYSLQHTVRLLEEIYSK